jgi:hypothetical protein
VIVVAVAADRLPPVSNCGLRAMRLIAPPVVFLPYTFLRSLQDFDPLEVEEPTPSAPVPL